MFILENINSATIIVGPPPASIQNAINIASNGDTIQLSAGTYVQEVQVISKSLNIVGAGENVSIIQAPNALTHLSQFFTFGTNFWCIVMINNTNVPTPQTVNISDLTVDGNNQQDTTIPPIYGSSDRFFAIGYRNANGTIQNVHTTNTRQTSSFNELAGGGIVNASDLLAVTFNVTNCLVDFYQRIGIDCRGSTLTANISQNTVDRGFILTSGSTATPNGIQFTSAATGSITNNVVSNNVATVLGASATGILAFSAGANLLISGNTINNNDNGIASISTQNNLTVSNNTINFNILPGVNPDVGIGIQDTNGITTISSNIMNNIFDINMNLISSTNEIFQLQNNQFIGSKIGLLVEGNTTAGPIVVMNSDSFVGTINYYIEQSASPNNIWPSTKTVSFDGLVSGFMTVSEYNSVLSKIYDQSKNPSLGIVLEFIPPTPIKNKFLNETEFFLRTSSSP